MAVSFRFCTRDQGEGVEGSGTSWECERRPPRRHWRFVVRVWASSFGFICWVWVGTSGPGSGAKIKFSLAF